MYQLDLTLAADLGPYALEWAAAGYRVFPLRGKAPAFANPHPKGSPERQNCKGECGLDGHGVHDATTDPAKIAARWAQGNFNIGVAVPEALWFLDADGPNRVPHPGRGMEGLARLKAEGHVLPETFMQHTGSGGRHFAFRRPAGKLTDRKLREYGLEYKAAGGYIVGAPSIYPGTDRCYVRVDAPIAETPAWLADMVIAKEITPAAPAVPRWSRTAASGRLRLDSYFGSSIADTYTTNSTWAEVLTPHGWSCDDADPDADGAVWLHPTATSKCSATVRNGCLFIYSSNTPFEVTTGSTKHGYTRFRAYALLNHRGDLKAAARALRSEGTTP
jgi:hypothetical protein